jgi:hypothetical protein
MVEYRTMLDTSRNVDAPSRGLAALNAKRQWNKVFDIRFFTGRNALTADTETGRFDFSCLAK